jgi:restriction endonuclease Mrr
MNATNLDAIRDGLAKERDSQAAVVAKARLQLEAAELGLGRIETALAVLDGDDLKTRKKKVRGHNLAARSLPAAGKDHVAKLVQSLLAQFGTLSEADLKRRVEELLQQQGFTLRGVALRVKEALSDPNVVTGPEGVALRRSTKVAHHVGDTDRTLA